MRLAILILLWSIGERHFFAEENKTISRLDLMNPITFTFPRFPTHIILASRLKLSLPIISIALLTQYRHVLEDAQSILRKPSSSRGNSQAHYELILRKLAH